MATESASSDLEMTSQVEDSDGGATEESLPSTSVSSETAESSDCKEEQKAVPDSSRHKLKIEVNNSIDFTDVTDLSNLDEMSFIDRKNSVMSENLDDFTDSKGKPPVPDFSKLAGEWYKHECFQRYWDHYHQVMSWCTKHYKTYNEVMGKTVQKSQYDHMQMGHSLPSRSLWQHPYSQMYPWQHSTWQTGYSVPEQTNTGACSCGQSKRSTRRRRKQKTRCQKSASSESLSQTDVNTNSEEFEMEITEEMVEFFTKSQEHRKQREEEKRGAHESGKTEPERINVEEVKTTNQKGPTVEAPKERPGARRTSEMKLLYGKGAAMIHGMETAVQMTYDRNIDIKQPKVWPNMPLKLVFG